MGYCTTILDEGGVLQESCSASRCCRGGGTGAAAADGSADTCCRVLNGNFGRFVAVARLAPPLLPTAGGRLTVWGRGFDAQLPLNRVRVGGVGCPLVSLNLNQGDENAIGWIVCAAPAGLGPDL